MGLKFYQTFSYVVVHFGDVPTKCIARVVGYDQMILYERPSDAAPHAQAMQADFRALGDRLTQINHKRESISKELC